MSLADLLSEAQKTLLHLRRRQFSVEAIHAELERVREGKPWVIHDDVAWTALLDHRDMNVIALASWAKAAYSPGGLFGQLQAHHVRALAAKRSWNADDEDPYLARILDENFYSKHADLFPQCVVKPDDVAALRNLFEVASGPLLADRSDNRAHPFEKGRGDAPRLGIDEMRELFETFGQFLNEPLAHRCRHDVARHRSQPPHGAERRGTRRPLGDPALGARREGEARDAPR